MAEDKRPEQLEQQQVRSRIAQLQHAVEQEKLAVLRLEAERGDHLETIASYRESMAAMKRRLAELVERDGNLDTLAQAR